MVIRRSKRTVVHELMRQRSDFINTKVPAMLTEYAFESLLGCWGFIAGVAALFPPPGSERGSINQLPEPLPVIWGLLMLLAGITIAFGLIRKHYGTLVARGLYLFGSACVAYSAAITSNAGLARGGAVALLLLAIGGISWLRAWYLRAREILLLKVVGGEIDNGEV